MIALQPALYDIYREAHDRKDWIHREAFLELIGRTERTAKLYLSQLLSLGLIESDKPLKRGREKNVSFRARIPLDQVRKILRNDEKDSQPERKKRKCLRCQEDFMSEWVGNRICEPCSQLNRMVGADMMGIEW
ncbi:hypothetical protein [Kiloniella sp. b19]|uniref:hypothetical protein n=1 Tax=Kiloniella sp. GXU_MW_B19 TaxID=3141326 RepID=UPI0031D9E7BD